MQLTIFYAILIFMRTLFWQNVAPNGEEFHVTSLHLAGRRSYEVHAHDFVELFLVEHGRLMHRVNDSERLMEKGEAGLMRAEDAHGFRSLDEKGFVYTNLAFPFSTLCEFHERYFPESRIWNCDEPIPVHLRLTRLQEEWLSATIQELSQLPRDRFEIDRFLLGFHHQLRSHPAQRPSSSQAIPDWLWQAMTLFREEGWLDEGRAAFFRLAGRCEEHVSRELKRHTGKTPSEFVNSVRLDVAAQRLVTSNDDIATIALDVGFRNLGHFYTLFRKRFHLTPRSYRQKRRSTII